MAGLAVTPIALIASESATNGTNGPHTTAAIDTTGADLLVMAVSYIDGFTMTVSDSESNTWLPLTDYLGGGAYAGVRTKLFYVTNPTTDAAHTFTAAAGSNYASVAVAGFSNVLDGVVDFSSGDGSDVGVGGTTVQPGSITPSGNNALIFSAMGYVGNGPASIDSDFTILEQIDNSAAGGFSMAIAYKIQTTAEAVNPTWSSNEAVERIAASMAAFKHISMPADPVNYAAAANGGTANAISENHPVNYPASACLNGIRHANAQWDIGGGWLAASWASGNWIENVLSAPTSVERARIYFLRNTVGDVSEVTLVETGSSFIGVDFTLQYWDGDSWEVLATVTANDKIGVEVTFSPVVADTFRWVFTQPGAASVVAVCETEIYDY